MNRFMKKRNRKHGAVSITIRDVARRAHVSVGTVSRVMNNLPDVNSELRARVQEVLEELNYRPNARARSFARNSSPTLSFILSNRDFLHPSIPASAISRRSA
jgi:LacI family transcriptional regulator